MTTWLTACMAALCMTSCLGDDEMNTVVYQDTAITAFTLGTVKRTMHTTSSTGEDSTYTASVTGSNYKFYIDQQQGLIYNADSLPQNCDLSRVLCTMSSKNSGSVILNLRTADGTKDSLVLYNATDSINLTKPMEVRVFNQAGTAFRRYTLTVNIHQEDGEEFHWTLMTNGSPFGMVANQRLLAVGDRVMLFGTKGTGDRTYMYDVKANLSAPTEELEVAQEFGIDAIDNLTKCGDELLVRDGNRLWHITATDDGRWDSRYDDLNLEGVGRLIGGSGKEIYALDPSGGLLVSVDNGQTWSSEELDNPANLLPTDNINCTSFALNTNDGMSRVMLVGTRPEADREYAVVWMKIVDESHPSVGRWLLVADGTGRENQYGLPRCSGLSIVPYEGNALAMGLSDGQNLAPVLMSADGGITWKTSSVYAWADDANGMETLSATVDDSNFIWVVMSGSGQVWRGRLNRLGWDAR